MTRSKRKAMADAARRRRLPVIEAAQIECERLHATFSASVCTARYRLAHDRTSLQTNGYDAPGSVPYVSCLRCPDGERRTGGTR